MKKKPVKRYILLSILFFSIGLNSQVLRTSDYLTPRAIPHRTLLFNLSEAGQSKPLEWGLDMAWLSQENILRGIAFMGNSNIDIIRSSFTPTDSLVNGDLKAAELTMLNNRLAMLSYFPLSTKIMLNCDHPTVHSWYLGRPDRWAQLINVTAKRHRAAGREIASVAPFNEPDFGWGQYTGYDGKSQFLQICNELRKNSQFDAVRLSGGNTLNCDEALNWYGYLRSRLDEGNTHQLAGSFDNFASFFTTVRANGDHATADECHNVMEPMVGVEYGLQTAIWWGTAEYARGEFVKASDGARLAYAEHRPNWTAASVYRAPDGKVQAFGGTSERQAVTTTYRFVSKDRDVFFEGYGPLREYYMELPGGTGYQNGQTGAERVVNITTGEDIQPIINGKYILINRISMKAVEVAVGSTVSGATIWQKTYRGYNYQQWNVVPVSSRIGGDFSYFTISAVHSAKVMENTNYSLSNGSSVTQYDDLKGANQQWFLEYAGDGWFYIRNRHSAKCLQVAAPYTTEGASIQQSEKNGNTNQQWRLIPVGAPVEFVAPQAPVGLSANVQSASVLLNWNANTESDLASYTIFRSESADGVYNTLAQRITANSFVDNSVLPGKTYYYKIKAVDNSLNRSAYSNQVSVVTLQDKALVAHYNFENSTRDTTINQLNAAAFGSLGYSTGKNGASSVLLNGSSNYVQLPYTVANYNEITIATWVNWMGTTAWQRIFDFGNGENEYMFLTPKSSSGYLYFGLKHAGNERVMVAPALTARTWTHVAVTLSATGAKMYVNGALVSQSAVITIRPSDINPVLNYIGRSQFSDPLFMGLIDDFRIYNYAMTATEVAQLTTISALAQTENNTDKTVFFWPLPVKDKLNFSCLPLLNITSEVIIRNIEGRTLKSYKMEIEPENNIDISDFKPGVYFLQVRTGKHSSIQRFIKE